jgi:beta-glucan synthesis-associated protein KRE6
MGYPIIAFAQSHSQTLGAFNLGGVNGSGQVAATIGNFGLIDNDTPTEAFTKKAHTGDDWQLVFSDEFEVDGRTFWPGDDPFFEAIDLHAWATNDLEYYDPRAISTKNGMMLVP